MPPERPSWLPLVDLTAVTRDANAVRTEVSVQLGDGRFVPWIRLGALTTIGDRLNFLGAYYVEGVTDGDHASAYAMHIDVSHVLLEGVRYGRIYLKAWIAGAERDAEHLCLPPKSVLSLADVEGVRCDTCEGDDHGHLIVPRFTPEPDVALWKRLRGRALEIEILPGVSLSEE